MGYGEQALKLREILGRFPNGVSLSVLVVETGCSVTNIATLLKNWTDSNHVVRQGKRGSFLYCRTNKKFVFKEKEGKVRSSIPKYEEIAEAIIGFNFSWFKSGQIVLESGVSTNVVCPWLNRLARRGILEQRSVCPKGYEYRQVKKIKIFLPKGELASLVYEVFSLTKKGLSVDDLTLSVMHLIKKKHTSLKLSTKSRSQIRDRVRVIVGRWMRDGAISPISPLDKTSFVLSERVTARPVSVCK